MVDEGRTMIEEQIAAYRNRAVRHRNYERNSVTEPSRTKFRVKARVDDAHADCLQAFIDQQANDASQAESWEKLCQLVFDHNTGSVKIAWTGRDNHPATLEHEDVNGITESVGSHTPADCVAEIFEQMYDTTTDTPHQPARDG